MSEIKCKACGEDWYQHTPIMYWCPNGKTKWEPNTPASDQPRIECPECSGHGRIAGNLCITCGGKCYLPYSAPASGQPEKCVHCEEPETKHKKHLGLIGEKGACPVYKTGTLTLIDWHPSNRFTPRRPITDQPEILPGVPSEPLFKTEAEYQAFRDSFISHMDEFYEKCRRPIAAEKREDTRTCGEISCDECNERYQKAIAEISTLRRQLAEARSESHAGDCSIYAADSTVCDCGFLLRENSKDPGGKYAEQWAKHLAGIAAQSQISTLQQQLAEQTEALNNYNYKLSASQVANDSLQKQFGVCSICGFIAWKSRETQPDVEDCQYCARVVENERLQKLNDIMHKFSVFCHSKTCIHHTDAERKESGCPVCLQKQLAQEKEARLAWEREANSMKLGNQCFQMQRDNIKIDRDNLREALRPVVEKFMERAKRYVKAHSDWFDKMPGHWTTTIELTMTQGRAARAALQQSEGK